jgi:hypothetical protein
LSQKQQTKQTETELRFSGFQHKHNTKEKPILLLFLEKKMPVLLHTKNLKSKNS